MGPKIQSNGSSLALSSKPERRQAVDPTADDDGQAAQLIATMQQGCVTPIKSPLLTRLSLCLSSCALALAMAARSSSSLSGERSRAPEPSVCPRCLASSLRCCSVAERTGGRCAALLSHNGGGGGECRAQGGHAESKAKAASSSVTRRATRITAHVNGVSAQNRLCTSTPPLCTRAVPSIDALSHSAETTAFGSFSRFRQRGGRSARAPSLPIVTRTQAPAFVWLLLFCFPIVRGLDGAAASRCPPSAPARACHSSPLVCAPVPSRCLV